MPSKLRLTGAGITTTTSSSGLELLFIFGYHTYHRLGITDENSEGNWVLQSSGEGLTYTNWAENEPNNAGGREHCAMLGWTDDGHWNDYRCNYDKWANGRYWIAICEL